MKHKVIKDFQLLVDKKIVVLKSGTTLVDYKYITKSDNIQVEIDIVNQNPDYFLVIDWKTELTLYMKQNKLPQPAVLSKKLIPFIEEMFILNVEKPKTDDDYDLKVKKVEKLEKELREELKDIDVKNELVRSKTLEIRKKEDELRDYEYELGKRERGMDKSLLESEKNVDFKQSEMNERLEKNLIELEARELKYSIDMDNLDKSKKDLQTYIVEIMNQNVHVLSDKHRDNLKRILSKL
jgi:hypothetical protein